MFKVYYSDNDVQNVELFKGTKCECITYVSHNASVDNEHYQFTFAVNTFGESVGQYHITSLELVEVR